MALLSERWLLCRGESPIIKDPTVVFFRISFDYSTAVWADGEKWNQNKLAISISLADQ